MSVEKAIEILRTYRLWSCGEGIYEDYKEKFPFTKVELNKAVELAIEMMEVHG